MRKMILIAGNCPYEEIVDDNKIIIIFANKAAEFPSNLNVIIIDDPFELLKTLENYNEYIISKNFEIKCFDKNLCRILKGFINNIILKNNLDKVQKSRILSNLYSNVLWSLIYPGWNIIKRFSKQLTAPSIIVSAGPSLKNDLTYLKNIQNRVIIVSVGTVYNLLLNEGIIPDFAIYIDASKKEWEDFSKPIESSTNHPTITILNIEVDPRFFEYEKAKYLLFRPSVSSIEETYKALEKCNLKIEPALKGLSVAHAAFFMASNITQGPLILLGQDLSVGEKGEHYPESVRDIKHLPENLIEIPGIYGEKVKTTWELWLFKEYFEKLALLYRKSGRILVNATSRGVKIKGFVHKNLHSSFVLNLINAFSKNFKKGEFWSLMKKIYMEELLLRKNTAEILLPKVIECLDNLKIAENLKELIYNTLDRICIQFSG